LPSNESYPQYVVTALIVAHDGATWLPTVADALANQTRAVQRVVAVDTGSRDRSGAILASKFGRSAVFGMDRATGYGAAVARALSHRAANLPVPGAGGIAPGDRVEWIWLLHDDSEPAPDALDQLLRGAAETNAAAVLGPKLRDWSNREFILEAGLTLDTAARRLTGIDPREVDQGQHDGDRDALAVSSAGMLVRRDVWEQVGGFDAGMGLFMEDVDFCWRVHSAGYRVRVITDAVCYHALAATRHRRPISVGRRARMLDRRNGLLTLLGNLPFGQMLACAAGNVVVSLLRIAFFLLAKRLTAAVDEAGAASSVLCHPFRLISMRRRRSRGRRAAYSRVKADLPPGHSVRRLAEFAALTMAKSQNDTTGAHHASADPTEDDSMLVDNGLGRRLLTSPALMIFVALLAIALIAGRSLIGGGPLGGGSLVPAWGGASDLWHSYLQAFHPVGLGSSTQAPPYIAVMAALATVLVGKPWLATDVILIGCVPLAGMSAMLAIRRITTSAPIRVWASATYALLPVAMGVVAAGRFGTAVAFVLLPLIALCAGEVVTQPGARATRAAWASGLLLALASAFVPLLWLVALAGCVITAVALRNTRPGLLRNLAIVALTAPVLLLPWTLTVFSAPVNLLLEAGLPQPGSPPSGLSGKMLILLSPGGAGLPPYWVTAGLLAAALAALFAGRRRKLITAGWGVALTGMLLAVVVSHLVVTPPDGGSVVVWVGLPLAIAAIGLLVAACAGAEGLGRMLTAGKGKGKGLSWIGTGRGALAVVIAAVASSAPVLAAVFWLGSGVSGPVHQVSSQVVPELVAVADGQSHEVRTLVLRSVHGHIAYLLLRGPSPSLADPALTSPPAAQQALAKAVAALTTPAGGLAVNQSQLLADFDIGYVLVEAPVNQQLAAMLDDVNGLRPYSTTPSYGLWQLITPPSRVSVLESDGAVVSVPSGQVGVSGAVAPAAGGILMLAEPAGGWRATINGHALTPVPSPAGSWAQAFSLPAGGGSLDVGHTGFAHDLWLLFELLALLAVIGLALPGIRVADEAQLAGGAPAAEPRAAGASADADDASDDAADGPVPGARRSQPAGPGRRVAAGGRRGVVTGAAGLASTRSKRGRGAGRSKPSRGKPARERAGTSRARSRGQEREPGRLDEDLTRLDEPVASARTSRTERADTGDWSERDFAERSGPAQPAGLDRLGSDEPGGRRPADWDSADPLPAAWPDRRQADDSQPPGDLDDLGGERDGRLADAWPHADFGQSGRDRAGRSPSGAAPPAQWSSQSRDDYSDAGRGYQASSADSGGYRRSEESLAPAPPWTSAREPDRLGDWAGLRSSDPGEHPFQTGPSGRPREIERAEARRPDAGGYGTSRPEGDEDFIPRYELDPDAAESSQPGRYTPGQHAAGRPDVPSAGRHEPDPYEPDRYAARSQEIAPYEPGAYQAGRHAPGRYEPPRDDDYRQLPASQRDYREAGDPYARAGRPAGRDPGYGELDALPAASWDDDEQSAGGPSRNRWGAPGARPASDRAAISPRYASSGTSQPHSRGQGQAPDWPSAGGDALEPLPPPSGQAQAPSSRAAAWRPDVRDGGAGWGDPGGSGYPGESSRRSAPDQDTEADRSGQRGSRGAQAGHPYEPAGEYDGDDRHGQSWPDADGDEGDTW
jgi:GT2 family glycosyltransferase